MKNCRPGFTLIEWVVVLGIIAMLLLLGLPNLFEANRRTQESRLRLQMRAFHEANEGYHRSRLPVTYAPNLESLTRSSPPYLDKTWEAPSRSGFDLQYLAGGEGKESYALFAVSRISSHVIRYCIDQRGILFGGADLAATGEGCSGGAPIYN